MIHTKKGKSVAIVAMGQTSIEWLRRHYSHGSKSTYTQRLHQGFSEVVDKFVLNEDQVDRLHFVVDSIASTNENHDKGPEYDEVWAISHMGGELREVDMIFAMDDMKTHGSHWPRSVDRNVPLMTSTKYPEFPRAVEYPLNDVVQDFGVIYFKNTAAYALAYAIHKGYERIGCFGVDFFYQDSKLTERGMGCFMFWAGIAHSRGISLDIAEGSATMDRDKPNTLYGYAEQPQIQLENGVAEFDGRDWYVSGTTETREGDTPQEDVQDTLRP